jgi:hypothetical protein
MRQATRQTDKTANLNLASRFIQRNTAQAHLLFARFQPINGVTMKLFVTSLGLTLALSASAADSINAEVKRHSGSNLEISHDCADAGTLEITGSNNEVEVIGDCQRLTLTGSNSTVTLEGIVQISMIGSNNEVSYKRVLGKAKKPDLSLIGTNNQVYKDSR